ncbi:carboxynorspermidine decarboxylase [Ostreibacterium oceani]|uniref:Carboxynorspermidine/carboxyspermidine decarboxylase n=1 Tax=Ostreibacterium oceani TaxID=2654998 RepID=A0A6N7EXE6_9GAMM|nr:carboxynorspermidine decarboxylase [Ostreibacterium oceani]MPV85807.1 carboxynorspermidine decarboxylase [Ostreibacterium oceani]
MQFTDFSKLDLSRLPSPCFVVDEVALVRNLQILQDVSVQSGAKVLGALKAFSMWHFGALTSQYLHGICASGLHEARLGKEAYGGEVHVFSAAYSEADLRDILGFANHVVFNSPSQWQRFKALCLSHSRADLDFGLRINPEHSEGAVPIYDPCAPGSRLGMTLAQLETVDFEGISGLHFHTLCEQGFAPLDRTLRVVEEKFAPYFDKIKWINFGGGHHITAPGYDTSGLVKRVQEFKAKYNLDVYLEPGEAMAIGTGILSTQVLDITYNALPQAILDTSATCHMPDTLEMPYRADILYAGEANQHAHTYRLGGLTCLAGDVIGDYSFTEPLHIGQRLAFLDMAHYTMVKTTTFNGTRLPAIAVWNSDTDTLQIIREFGYDDFKTRLS